MGIPFVWEAFHCPVALLFVLSRKIKGTLNGFINAELVFAGFVKYIWNTPPILSCAFVEEDNDL